MTHPHDGPDDTVVPAVERAVGGLTHRFGAFHRPRLHAAATAMHDRLAATTIDVDVPLVLDSLLAGLADDLDAIAVRALITSFRASGESYEAFHTRRRAGGASALIESGRPELVRLLDLTVRRTVRHAVEVIDDLEAEAGELGARLGLSGTVDAIVLGRGDKHDGGRSAAFVSTVEGGRVVHKPTAADQGRMLRELAEAADPTGVVFGPVTPDVWTVPGGPSRRTHSWQRFVVHEDLLSPGAVARWYHRYGALTALAASVGATDLHFENLVATRDGPVVIDVETVSSVRPRTDPAASAHAALGERIHRSVLHSMLLPTRFAGSRMSADISGLRSAATAAAAVPGFAVVDAGLDSMRFDDTDITLPTAPNAVTCGGVDVDARNHLSDIVAGYRRGRAALVAVADRFDEILARALPDTVRQVVRPTYVYARFLDASTHPVYLGSIDDRRELLSRLPARYRSIAPEAADRLHAAEVASLLDLDVPSFQLCRGHTAIGVLGDGEVAEIPDAVERDLAATVRAWFDDFLRRDGERDTADIALALTTAADDVWQSDRRPDRGFTTPPRRPTLTWSMDGTTATWLSAVMIGAGLRLAPVNLTLFEGGGQLVAISESAGTAEAVLGPAEIDAVVRGAVVHRLPASPPVWQLSPYTGPVSELVVLLELAARGRAVPIEVTLPGQHAAPTLSHATMADLDHLNGLGGYFRALRVYAEAARAVDPEALGSALDRFLAAHASALRDGGDDVGLAHGSAGRLLAVADAMVLAGGHRSARSLLEHGVRRWRSRIVHGVGLKDERARSSWCKGAAGTVFAHEQILRALGADRASILSAVEPELDILLAAGPVAPDADVDASLCHGVAGTAAVLGDLGVRLDVPELRGQARDLVERAGRGRPRAGLRRAPELDTFFLGSSGWDVVRAGGTLPRLLGGVR